MLRDALAVPAVARRLRKQGSMHSLPYGRGSEASVDTNASIPSRARKQAIVQTSGSKRATLVCHDVSEVLFKRFDAVFDSRSILSECGLLDYCANLADLREAVARA